MGKLFGTDGIRGKAGHYPMDGLTAFKVGNAIARYFKNKNNKIIIAKDTRISGDMLESAIASGIISYGIDVHILNIMPTPALAFLSHYLKANAGIMISASHNPYLDNGIKVFNDKGFKLSNDEENELEELIFGEVQTNEKMGKIYPIRNAEEPYLNFLENAFKLNLKGFKIALDCANGVNYNIAPSIFEKLGAKVFVNANLPNGLNINENCGSEHIEKLSQIVQKEKADLGFAFDGDGDRLVIVDENGEKLNGDALLFIFADFLKAEAKLRNNTMVSTVMSNLGLKQALLKRKIKHIESKVGDRYVVLDMLQNDAIIGGENSGHIVFLDKHTTGDGLYAALKFLEVVLKKKQKVSDISKSITIFPQVLINVKVKKKEPLEKNPSIYNAIKNSEKELKDKGRVLVRYSGTENICRVMVEAETKEETQKYAKQIAEIIEKELN